MIAPRPTNSGVCAVGARQPTAAQSPTAQPRQESVTETWVSVEMGESKTVLPASTREETSSLQPVRLDARRFDCCLIAQEIAFPSP